jgi:hypothetical protein
MTLKEKRLQWQNLSKRRSYGTDHVLNGTRQDGMELVEQGEELAAYRPFVRLTFLKAQKPRSLSPRGSTRAKK